jgi:signal transduction histidine kinase
MQRLLLSFLLVFLLVAGLLGYFLHVAYLEEKEVLVERIGADIRENRADQLVEQVRNLRGIAINGNRDSFISIHIAPKNDTPPSENGSRWLRAPDDRDEVPVQWSLRPDQELTGSSVHTFEWQSVVDSAFLDTLSRQHGVTLINFASVQDLQRAGALFVPAPTRSNRFSGRGGQVIGAIHYRYTLLRGLIYEGGFAVLLLAAIGVAFYSAFRSLTEQRRQLREREALVANVAHELKTPIATVGVALEAIDRFGVDTNPQRRREYVDLSRNELNRLDRMADRAIASLEYDNLSDRLTLQPTDLTALTQQAWRGLALRYQIDESILTLYPERDVTLTGDPHYLFHAIHNLLDNGVKYGGDPPRLRVSIRTGSGGTVSYTVHDNGGGIPPHLAARMFDRFYRGPDDGHRTKGHGLGLSFVRQIAEAHGGSVAAGTDPEGGGWVRLSLPRR